MRLFNKLKIVVFISGASVMMLEMVGSRLLAPFVGTSIYIWTSLIGIILASLSIGYYLGGNLADKNPNPKILSLILATSALFISLTATFNQLVLLIVGSLGNDIRVHVIIATLILFTPASILLGTISPFAAKLSLQNLSKTGKMIGSLSALSNAGSILGTFLAGFYLVALLGSTNLLYLISALLLFTAFFLNISNKFQYKLIVSLILGYLVVSNTFILKDALSNTIVDKDTQYNRVWIIKTKDNHGNPIKLMNINDENSSAIFFDSEELAFDYAKLYQLVEVFKPDFKKTLLIGGAGYTYPTYFLKQYPYAFMDVVEIDPGITQLAREHFNLIDNPRMKIIHEDGRVFLNNSTDQYDVIFGDAFKSRSVPFQLTTVETLKQMYRLLSDDGVVIANLIGSIEGDRGRFVRASYHTYKEVFPQVYLIPVSENIPADSAQNIILIASKKVQPTAWSSTNPQLQNYLSRMWNKPLVMDSKLLTDDFAPVEYYTKDID